MLTRRHLAHAGLGLSAAAMLSPGGARSQAAALRIGFSVAQSGGLAAAGRAGLLALEIWRDMVNAKGGIMGRKVELVVYDDQSSAAQVPSIYAKLLDVDQVDILLSPYGTNAAGPTVAMAKDRNRVLFGMFSTGLNGVQKYDRYFDIGPWGPDAQLVHKAFFDLVRDKGCKKLAILAADAEFQQNSAEGGRRLAKEYGIQVVYDQRYPANTTDFTALLQSLRSSAPGAVYVCSYPTESAAIIRGVGEIKLPSSVQLFGGGIVGIQNAALLTSLGAGLNGIVNYDVFSTSPKVMQAGAAEFLAEYGKRAGAAKVDSLGYYTPPYWFSAGQIIEATIQGAGGVDDAAMARWLHANEVVTILGPIRFNATGEWTENRVLMVQYRGLKGRDLEQFRSPGKVVVVAPDKFKTGDVIMPFAKAQA